MGCVVSFIIGFYVQWTSQWYQDNYNNPLKSCIVTYHDINLITVRYYVNTVFWIFHVSFHDVYIYSAVSRLWTRKCIKFHGLLIDFFKCKCSEHFQYRWKVERNLRRKFPLCRQPSSSSRIDHELKLKSKKVREKMKSDILWESNNYWKWLIWELV